MTTDQQRMEAVLEIQGTTYAKLTNLGTGKVRIQVCPTQFWEFDADGGFAEEPWLE